MDDEIEIAADETHDAMMAVYMNRFGEQVETATPETLLENWHGARRRKNLMTSNSSHLVQILLPKESGNG